MKKHIVTCVKCGRQFDANEGGAYYPESRRYVCKHCVDKQKDIQKEQAKARKAAEREAEADERERVTGMRQNRYARKNRRRCSVPVRRRLARHTREYLLFRVRARYRRRVGRMGTRPVSESKKREALSYVCQFLEAPKVNERFSTRSRPPADSALLLVLPFRFGARRLFLFLLVFRVGLRMDALRPVLRLLSHVQVCGNRNKKAIYVH